MLDMDEQEWEDDETFMPGLSLRVKVVALTLTHSNSPGCLARHHSGRAACPLHTCVYRTYMIL